MIHTEDEYYSSSTMMRDIYNFHKKLESLTQQMDLKSFSDDLYIICQSISTQMLLEFGARSEALEKALFDIVDFVKFRMGNIKWIKEFKHMIHSKKVKPYTFAKNVYTLKPDFAKQLPLKISLLRSVLKNHNLESVSSEKLQRCSKNLELQTLIEMLVLDILSVIEGLPNQLNHIIEVKDILQEKLGKKVQNDPIKSKKSSDIDLSVMKKQKQFFIALAVGLNKKEVTDYISEGVDIYGRDLNSNTALHFAAKSPNPEILKFLLTFNLDVNAKNDNHQTVLHVAANSGRESIVKYLIEEMKMPVDGKDINGKTPLSIASKKGHKDVVTILLEHKADMYLKDVFGYAPLHYAVLENHFNVVTVLLENETDVDANQTFYGFTALHLAASMGHLNLVNCLLEKKVDVNFKSDMDYVPLHFAASGGHFEVAKLLLKNGANDGNIAASKLLLEKGATVANPSENAASPLEVAAYFGHLELVKELLNDAGENSKILALMRAASRGHLAVVELLLDSGVDIKARSHHVDSTALHFAAEKGHLGTVKLLLDREAEINAQDGNGDTALHLSSRKEHKEVVRLLIKRKADILIHDKTDTFPLEIIVKKGMTDLLIKEKIVVDFSYTNDISPFHFAAYYGDINFVKYCVDNGFSENNRKILELLIKRGADLSTEKERSLFLSAVTNGHEDIVDFFLSRNPNILTANANKDEYPLHRAVIFGHVSVVKKMLDKGKKDEMNLMDKNFKTPLLIAVEKDHCEVAQLLVSKGADPNISSKDGNFPFC
ncbi:Ankyrin-3 like protein [Argiope bruennichi]|uniref:Ankyrin-3 like protein n=1 Tax=Argiope bruennichi TaxID=94029 RepID=A0A8T0EFI7_ARGBR|nr:Ankyrin-3 like protein [Argiope bruennichi]